MNYDSGGIQGPEFTAIKLLKWHATLTIKFLKKHATLGSELQVALESRFIRICREKGWTSTMGFMWYNRFKEASRYINSAEPTKAHMVPRVFSDCIQHQNLLEGNLGISILLCVKSRFRVLFSKLTFLFQGHRVDSLTLTEVIKSQLQNMKKWAYENKVAGKRGQSRKLG